MLPWFFPKFVPCTHGVLGRGNLTQDVEKRLGLRLGQDSIKMLFITENS